MTSNENIKTIERIQELQKDLHGIAMTGMLTLAIIGSKGIETAILENTLETIHNVSHAIQDVLDGKTSKQAINSNLASEDDEEGDE
ncbi:hypothetical protein [Streptococcus xiaochunlingii]|uniref:Uncharacterized protein n=1 Tax=Streptococcus xiaochunlingii TaxID=2589788 RepID=A0ABY2YDT8_9STRE|nr:hypothetical protein [Streptococcus xiaochunlingii]TPE36649.1 hypothetical protein FJR71_07575 [Streptococcus xiaochunlingii]